MAPPHPIETLEEDDIRDFQLVGRGTAWNGTEVVTADLYFQLAPSDVGRTFAIANRRAHGSYIVRFSEGSNPRAYLYENNDFSFNVHNFDENFNRHPNFAEPAAANPSSSPTASADQSAAEDQQASSSPNHPEHSSIPQPISSAGPHHDDAPPSPLVGQESPPNPVDPAIGTQPTSGGRSKKAPTENLQKNPRATGVSETPEEKNTDDEMSSQASSSVPGSPASSDPAASGDSNPLVPSYTDLGDGRIRCDGCAVVMGNVRSWAKHPVRCKAFGEAKAYPCPREGCRTRCSTAGDISDHLGTHHGEYPEGSTPELRERVTYLARRLVTVLREELEQEQVRLAAARTESAIAERELVALAGRGALRRLLNRHPKPEARPPATAGRARPTRRDLAQDLSNQRWEVRSLMAWTAIVRQEGEEGEEEEEEEEEEEDDDDDNDDDDDEEEDEESREEEESEGEDDDEDDE